MSGDGEIDMKKYRGADLVNPTDWAMNSTGFIGDNEFSDAPYSFMYKKE